MRDMRMRDDVGDDVGDDLGDDLGYEVGDDKGGYHCIAMSNSAL